MSKKPVNYYRSRRLRNTKVVCKVPMTFSPPFTPAIQSVALVLYSVQHTKHNFVINGNYILSQS